MTETATGIILRTRHLTESSLIIHWLTPLHGRLSTVAKGARRSKSTFRGKLDLFYTADFSFVRSRRSELHTLREVTVREMHGIIRFEMGYLRQASYGVALIEQSTETDTPLPGVYALLSTFLEALVQAPPQGQTLLAFELKLTHELGLAPDLRKSHLSAGSQQLVKALQANSWEQIRRLKPSTAQAAEISQFLHGFLIYHLGRIPKGRGANFPGTQGL